MLELAYDEDTTRQQIAALTGAGTVKSHIRRGMASRKRSWEVDGAAPGPRPAGLSGVNIDLSTYRDVSAEAYDDKPAHSGNSPLRGTLTG